MVIRLNSSIFNPAKSARSRVFRAHGYPNYDRERREADNEFGEDNISHDCVGEGESCGGDQTCCDNLKCEKGKQKGVDCDLAIAFDSDECGESASVNICKK